MQNDIDHASIMHSTVNALNNVPLWGKGHKRLMQNLIGLGIHCFLYILQILLCT